MPLTGALKDWVAKLKAYQDKHGVSYKAAMSALKGTGSNGSKGRRKSHRGGSGAGVADNAEAFTPQGDAAPHAPAAAGATAPPPPPAAKEVAGFEVKALPQSGGAGLGMFEVGAATTPAQQQGGRRRRRRGSSKRSSKRSSRRSSSRRSSRRSQQQRRSRSRRGGSGSSLSYSDYA